LAAAVQGFVADHDIRYVTRCKKAGLVFMAAAQAKSLA
jgi:hypothetical protein